MRKLYTFLFAMLAFCGLAQAQVTFDFSGENAYELFGLDGFSSGTGATAVTDGDITSDVTATSGDVTITVSPSGKTNPNRMWSGSLRLYGGTLTIESKGDSISAISFTLNSSKWGDKNAADNGNLTKGSWTGNASKVVISIDANTQIKSMTVTLGEGGEKPIDPTPTINWTSSAESPLTVDSVIAKINQLSLGEDSGVEIYVKGKIVSITEISATYHNATYYISDDGTEQNQLMVFRGKGLNGADLNEGDIQVGDVVVVYGKVINYNDKTSGSTPEVSSGNKLYSINGNTGSEIVVPEYTTIQAMQDTAQVLGTAKVDIKYTCSNVVVTYVNDKNVFINDGSRGLLLYGTNSKNLKAGDKISGTLTGKLQLFRGLTELGDVDYTAIEIAEGEAPVPETIDEVGPIISNATRLQYESKLMTIEGIRITAEEDSINGAKFYIIDDSDNMLLLFFKNANDFKDLLLDLDAVYNVTGIIGNHNGVQLSPRTVDDFVNVSEIGLQTPVSGWDVENLIVAPGDSVVAHFTTNSDAKVTYLSEDESVATIDKNGNITIVGPGQTEISAETDATENFKSDYKSFTLTVTSGANGTIEHPFTVSDVLAFTIASKTDTIQTNAWVKGYIIGFVSNSKLVASADSAIASNIAIAASTDETTKFIPVELPKGDIRTALNLADVPSNLGKEVWLCGTITQYFGMNGLKQVKNFSFDGTDAVRSITVPTTANGAIYTLSGQRISAITKAGIYIVNGRKVVVK